MKIIKKSTLKRYIDSCVKREVAKRFSDADKYYMIKSSIDFPIPQDLKGPFTWPQLMRAYKKYAQLAKQNGYSRAGRVEYHQVGKQGTSRDFLNDL